MKKIIISMFLSSLLLTGCDQKSDDSAKTSTASEATESESGNINSYVEIYNQLVCIMGLQEAKTKYENQHIESISKDRGVSFPRLNYDYINEQFAAAEKTKGVSPELSSAGKDLKQKINLLQQDYNQFNIYYESGEYKTDNLAKGKAADASIKKHFEEAMISFNKYQDALNQVYKKEKADQLEKLKQSGDLYAYHTAASLNAAEELVNVFKSEDDLKNAEKQKEADAIANRLQQELSALNTESIKRKEKSPDAPTHSILGHLMSCLSYYRKFKETGDQSDYKFMVDGYNQAVFSSSH